MKKIIIFSLIFLTNLSINSGQTFSIAKQPEQIPANQRAAYYAAPEESVSNPLDDLLLPELQQIVWRYLDELQELHKLDGHHSHVLALATSNDGKIISGDINGNIIVWDAKTGKHLYKIDANLSENHGHTGSIKYLSFINGNKHIISASSDQTLKIWNASNGKYIKTLEGKIPMMEIAYSVFQITNDNKIIVGSEDKTIRIWDLNNGKQLHKLVGHDEQPRALITHNDKIISGDYSGTIIVWDIDGHLLFKLKGHTNIVTALEIINEKLVSASCDGTIRIWDLNTKQELHKLVGHDRAIFAIKIKNGKIISAGVDGSIRIWDAKTQKELHKLEGHTDLINKLLITEDNKIISGSWDGTIRLWDLQTGAFLDKFEYQADKISSAELTNDGEIILGLNNGKILMLTTQGMQIRTHLEKLKKRQQNNSDVPEVARAMPIKKSDGEPYFAGNPATKGRHECLKEK